MSAKLRGLGVCKKYLFLYALAYSSTSNCNSPAAGGSVNGVVAEKELHPQTLALVRMNSRHLSNQFGN